MAAEGLSTSIPGRSGTGKIQDFHSGYIPSFSSEQSSSRLTNLTVPFFVINFHHIITHFHLILPGSFLAVDYPLIAWPMT